MVNDEQKFFVVVDNGKITGLRTGQYADIEQEQELLIAVSKQQYVKFTENHKLLFETRVVGSPPNCRLHLDDGFEPSFGLSEKLIQITNDDSIDGIEHELIVILPNDDKNTIPWFIVDQKNPLACLYTHSTFRSADEETQQFVLNNLEKQFTVYSVAGFKYYYVKNEIN